VIERLASIGISRALPPDRSKTEPPIADNQVILFGF
jgi:hypothetical protein